MTTPTAQSGPFYVMLDHEQSADIAPTIEAAREKARAIIAREPLPCHVSIQDHEGNHIEDVGDAPGFRQTQRNPQPGTPEHDAQRAAINRAVAQRDASNPVQRLSCACCGAYVRGRQWHNRDTGYGVCAPCVSWQRERGTSADEIVNNYGAEGIHYGADL